MVRNKLRQPGLWWAEGLRSARSFALMSGVYAWVACLAQRVRRTEDGVNRGLAGCATGLVLGWNGPNPPLLAAQTCLGLGALSYFVDLAPAASTPPAQAATLSAVARSAAGESADSLQRAAGQPCISSCCQLNLLPSGAALPSRRTAGATSSHPLLAFADAASGRLSGVLARRGGGWDDLDEGAATALWAARLPPVLALAQAAHADYFR